MEQEIHIILRLNFATSKVDLNEIVYKVKELRDPLRLKILKLTHNLGGVPWHDAAAVAIIGKD